MRASLEKQGKISKGVFMLGRPLYQNQALTQLCLTPALIPVKPTLGFTLNINDEYTPHR
jgi:hypothetical protein